MTEDIGKVISEPHSWADRGWEHSDNIKSNNGSERRIPMGKPTRRDPKESAGCWKCPGAWSGSGHTTVYNVKTHPADQALCVYVNSISVKYCLKKKKNTESPRSQGDTAQLEFQQTRTLASPASLGLSPRDSSPKGEHSAPSSHPAGRGNSQAQRPMGFEVNRDSKEASPRPRAWHSWPQQPGITEQSLRPVSRPGFGLKEGSLPHPIPPHLVRVLL